MTTGDKSILIGEQEFFYKEVQLFHGRKKMDQAISRENLKIFCDIVGRSGITFGIFFGTLLGAIREGRFITHDEDIDIYVLNEQRDLFLSLLYEFKNNQFELARVQNDMI